MSAWTGLVLAHASLAVLGGAAAVHPALRAAPLMVRLSAALACGALALTVEAMLWTMLGIPWSVATLALPAAVASGLLAVRWARRPSHRPVLAAGRSHVVAMVAGLVVAAALAHLVVAALTSLATSSDLLFFWSVKGSHFAAAGTLDPNTLAGPFAVHTHPSYPPLYPVLLAWWKLLTGALPWQGVAVASALYLLVAVVLVHHLLRRRCAPDSAAAATALWATALSLAVVEARSAGNAEVVLLLYESIALAALLSEPRRPAAGSRLVAGLALCGAVLTKNEGAVAALLIIVGALLRDRLWRCPWSGRATLELTLPAGAAWAVWLVVRAVCGLPLIDPIREPLGALSSAHVGTILQAMAGHLGAGSQGLAWLVPLLLLGLCWRSRGLARLLPALTLAGGLLGFLFVYYLHAVGDPSELVSWTFARVSLPALSALILAAAVGPRSADDSAPAGDQSTTRSGLAAR